MNRRGFLGSLVALMALPFAPKVSPKPSGLLFHKDAFALTMKPLEYVITDVVTSDSWTDGLPADGWGASAGLKKGDVITFG